MNLIKCLMEETKDLDNGKEAKQPKKINKDWIVNCIANKDD